MEFQLFRRFTQRFEVDEISKILESKNIRFKIPSPVSQLNSSLGYTYQEFFELYILPEDFTSVKQILETRAEAVVQNINADYYLFSFSDSELQNILSNPNDWNELDVILSTKILNDRETNSKSRKIAPLASSKDEQNENHYPLKKHSLADHFKYYAFLITTVFIGVILTTYMKVYHHLEINNTRISVAIAVLITINVLYYQNKHTCPKCKEKLNNERLHRLEQSDIFMPRPYNILERFKCHNCGHVWDEFSEESSGD